MTEKNVKNLNGIMMNVLKLGINFIQKKSVNTFKQSAFDFVYY